MIYNKKQQIHDNKPDEYDENRPRIWKENISDINLSSIISPSQCKIVMNILYNDNNNDNIGYVLIFFVIPSHK